MTRRSATLAAASLAAGVVPFALTAPAARAATVAPTVNVAASMGAYLVGEGGTATVVVRLTATGGAPLTAPVTISVPLIRATTLRDRCGHRHRGR